MNYEVFGSGSRAAPRSCRARQLQRASAPNDASSARGQRGLRSKLLLFTYC
jgi:hypothetical protein